MGTGDAKRLTTTGIALALDTSTLTSLWLPMLHKTDPARDCSSTLSSRRRSTRAGTPSAIRMNFQLFSVARDRTSRHLTALCFLLMSSDFNIPTRRSHTGMSSLFQLIKYFSVLVWKWRAARWTAPFPSLSIEVYCAPCSIRHFTASNAPLDAAKRIGVDSKSSLDLSSSSLGSWRIRCRRQSTWLKKAA